MSSRRWRRRLTFLAGGLIVGVVAAGLAVASDKVQSIFRVAVTQWPYAPLAVTPLGFAIIAFLTARYFPTTQGSGIPQTIAARSLRRTEDRRLLLGARAAIGKITLTLLGLLVGASTGREGPTVQVGASVMYVLGGLSPRRQSDLILAGAAAGVAAAFNTPLAGIVFAIEEMGRSFEARTSGLILGAVILAGLTAQVLLGNYTYFGFTPETLTFGYGWLSVPLCGMAGGLAGGLFSRALIATPGELPSKISAFIMRYPIAFAAMCGLGVALCGLASDGAVYGTGYEQARLMLHGTDTPTSFYTPLKYAATILSAVSGIPGGIFSPSLSIGASIGNDISGLFGTQVQGPIVLLGMVAYFTGVVRAPITGCVIVAEMSDNHAMLVPLLATAVIADASARLICRDGVYHVLARRFVKVAEGYRHTNP